MTRMCTSLFCDIWIIIHPVCKKYDQNFMEQNLNYPKFEICANQGKWRKAFHFKIIVGNFTCEELLDSTHK